MQCIALLCFVGMDAWPRARFDAVASKLLSALLAPSRLLAGPATLAFKSPHAPTKQ